MKLFEKLKVRWGITSTWQVFVIIVVFSFTGFSAVYARRFVFDILGIVHQDPFWLKAVVWLLTIFPLYNIFLLIYGAIFGQFEFFWNFFKKMMRRFVPGKSAP
ncbi:MAG: DUF6787 family protein [Balneolaceae bacterium]